MESFQHAGNLKIRNALSWKKVFPFFLWYIWRNRNANIFNKTNLDISINIVYERAVEYHHLTSKEKARHDQTAMNKTWTAPLIGIKLNVDGSFIDNSK